MKNFVVKYVEFIYCNKKKYKIFKNVIYLCIHSFIRVIEMWWLNVLSFCYLFIHSSNDKTGNGKLLNAFRLVYPSKQMFCIRRADIKMWAYVSGQSWQRILGLGVLFAYERRNTRRVETRPDSLGLRCTLADVEEWAAARWHERTQISQ